MAERPENIYVCPDCGGKYKSLKGEMTQKHFGKNITVHNIPFAICIGTSRTPGCGRPAEIVDARVSRRVYELAKDAAKDGKEEHIYYNEHYTD